MRWGKMGMKLDPAMQDAINNGRCYLGGEQVYEAFNEVGPAQGPGHIYSEAGLREYKNSGACEYHFDLAFSKLENEVFDELEIDSYSEEPPSPEEEEMNPPDDYNLRSGENLV
jgi:hypothetical protein